MKKIISYVLIGAFLLAFLFVSAQLIFGEKMDKFLYSVKQALTLSDDESVLALREELTMIYPEEVTTFEPTSLNPTIRLRTINICEPLIKADRDLKLRPALAKAWGSTDDLTWEFELRPNVYFHDGTKLDAKDVIRSIERAMKYSKSDLKEMLSTIKEIKSDDELNVRIVTSVPDPLLLQKLALVLIIPSEKNAFENENGNLFVPVGTNSYQISTWNYKNTLVLMRFDKYWGEKPEFKRVKLVSEPDKNKRIKLLLNGTGDFLAFTPFDAVSVFKEKSFEVETIPSMEVQFLLFNFNSQIFSDPIKRKVFSLAIDQEDLMNLIGGPIQPVNQFVSTGIFGFNPSIDDHEYDLEQAKKLAEESGFKGQTIQVHLPYGGEILGEHIRTQLNLVGVNAVISYLDGAGFEKSIREKKADIYFMGFVSDLGDSADFMKEVIESNGQFNLANYKNADTDKLIKSGLTEMNIGVRRDSLQSAMKKIVTEDIVGIPLFEYEIIYTFIDKIEFSPRIDGLVYFNEIEIE